MQRGMSLTLDLKVCRRLVAASCPYQGKAPTTALEAVRGYGHSLGDVLIVDVGYNEDGRGYPQGIDELMKAALAQGAQRVVWVTLRETRGVYHPANMRSAAPRSAGRSCSSPTGTLQRGQAVVPSTTACT